MTYNLYFDDGGHVSLNDAVSERFVSPRLPIQVHFRDAFAALLGNPEFMADDGTLASGLPHVYPIKKDLNYVYKILKGGDAMVYQSVLALGYEPVLYVYYEKRGTMIDKVVDFPSWTDAFSSRQGPKIEEVLYMEGGILAHPAGGHIEDGHFPKEDFGQGVEWVMPVTGFNRQTDPVALGYAGNEPAMVWAYGSVCLVVRVGKVSDRLTYRTVDQLERINRGSHRRDELGDMCHSVSSSRLHTPITQAVCIR